MNVEQRRILTRTGIAAAFAAAILLPINHVANGNGTGTDPFNAQLAAQALEVCNDR